MAKNTHKTIADNLEDSDDDDDFIRGDGEERDTSDDTDIVTAEQVVAVQSTRGGGACNHDQPNMISFDSTSGRPDFDELMETDDSHRHDSTGVYLCGPEVMVKNCKKAAGMGCQLA